MALERRSGNLYFFDNALNTVRCLNRGTGLVEHIVGVAGAALPATPGNPDGLPAATTAIMGAASMAVGISNTLIYSEGECNSPCKIRRLDSQMLATGKWASS
jgi:hypothetical protein